MLEMNRGTQVKDIGSMRKDMKTDLNFRQRSTCYLELVIKLLHNIFKAMFCLFTVDMFYSRVQSNV